MSLGSNSKHRTKNRSRKRLKEQKMPTDGVSGSTRGRRLTLHM